MKLTQNTYIYSSCNGFTCSDTERRWDIYVKQMHTTLNSVLHMSLITCFFFGLFTIFKKICFENVTKTSRNKKFWTLCVTRLADLSVFAKKCFLETAGLSRLPSCHILTHCDVLGCLVAFNRDPSTSVGKSAGVITLVGWITMVTEDV